MYFLKLVIYLIISASSVLVSVHATPVIGIGSMYDVITNETTNLMKRIYNTGDTTAFVRVSVLEINPMVKGGNEVPQKDLSGSYLEREKLIVTPQRLIIPPSGFQSVRILWSGNNKERERYFRVRFTPVMPEVNDGFGINQKEINDYRKNNLQAGLNVLTGYGSVVIVQPDNAIFRTLVDDADNKVIIKNNGNATISLDKLRYCKSANTDCGEVTREFILPGRIHSINKRKGYDVNFSLIEGENVKVMSY